MRSRRFLPQAIAAGLHRSRSERRRAQRSEGPHLRPLALRREDSGRRVRDITDSAATGLGFWVDNASIGGTPITDGSELSLGDAKSLTEAHPVKVAGWTVQVVSYGDTPSLDGDTSSHETLTLTPQQDGSYAGSFDLGSLPVTSLGTTGAIVTANDPEENAPGYPRYSLSVDSGKALPGGR